MGVGVTGCGEPCVSEVTGPRLTSERPALKMGVFLGRRWCLPQGDWWEGPTMTIGHHTQADPPVGLVGYETAVTDVTDTPTDLQKGRKKKHTKLFC